MASDALRDRYTCCVAGGGPAGVMAAVLLARAGIDTVVLEKHGDFLRDFRGDTIHPSTLDILGELGWLEALLRLPHQELDRIFAHIGDAQITVADFSHSSTREKFIALMPQWDLLNFLVERAREFPRFSVCMNANATDLVEEHGRITGVCVKTPEGERIVRADLVIAADGRHSTLRARAGLRVNDLGAPIDVLWLRLPRVPGDPETAGWIRRGHFIALIDRGDYWQIAYVIRKGGAESVQASGLEAFRRELAAAVPFLGGRVNELRSLDDVKLLVVTVDRLEKWWRPGLLCIGDSAHAMSPVGGVGINLAIQDAVATANIVSAPLAEGRLGDSHLAAVQRRREFPTRMTQAAQVAVQERLIVRALGDDRPLTIPAFLRLLLEKTSLLQRIPARLVGVGVRPEHVRSRLAP